MSEEHTKYQNFKKWVLEHKKEFQILIGSIGVFWLGFGVGEYNKNNQLLGNYNKNNQQQQKLQQEGGGLQEDKPLKTENKVADENSNVVNSSTQNTLIRKDNSCIIKGNISGTGSKIYHIKGGAFYERTNPEQCFNTEEEAKVGGFRKSSR